jgi:cytidylate kinase
VSGIVVAIDGPSASGKSSTARAVAERLGFGHLDSGSLYRAVTLVALGEAGRRDASAEFPLAVIAPSDVLRAAEDRGLMLQSDGIGFAAYLDGAPADELIRGAQVTAHASAIAAVPVVREWINTQLRGLVRAGRHVVVDGRDIGTVVFPDAVLKVFLTASPEARAARRISQRGLKIDPAALEQEAALLAARDRADSTRAIAPLQASPDAILVDTTRLSFAEQVELIVGLADERLGGR